MSRRDEVGLGGKPGGSVPLRVTVDSNSVSSGSGIGNRTKKRCEAMQAPNTLFIINHRKRPLATARCTT